MSKQTQFLITLLNHVSEFEKTEMEFSMEQFAVYLRDKTVMDEIPYTANGDSSNFKNYKEIPEVAFSTLLVQLYKFAKNYIKKVFQDKPWKSIEEYGFLATLLLHDSLTKNELITIQKIEVSSGSEILKRLIKSNLLHEYADPDDKRSKRVALTQEGRMSIINAFGDMHKVSEIIIGNLTETELKSTLEVFKKMVVFHNQIYKFQKDVEINQIYNELHNEK